MGKENKTLSALTNIDGTVMAEISTTVSVFFKEPPCSPVCGAKPS